MRERFVVWRRLGENDERKSRGRAKENIKEEEQKGTPKRNFKEEYQRRTLKSTKEQNQRIPKEH